MDTITLSGNIGPDEEWLTVFVGENGELPPAPAVATLRYIGTERIRILEWRAYDHWRDRPPAPWLRVARVERGLDGKRKSFFHGAVFEFEGGDERGQRQRPPEALQL